MNNWYLLAAIPVFGLLILVHEFGHFITAKWAGIRVEEFGLGLPPRLVGIRKREAGGWEVIWFGGKRNAEDTYGEDTTEQDSWKQTPFGGTSGGVSQPGVPVSDHTIYSINWLPIGGFVRMPGENGDINDEEGNYDPQSFAAKSAGKRLLVLVAGVTMNLLLAMLLFIVAYGFGEPQLSPQIGKVVANTPASAIGLQPNDTIISANGHPVKFLIDLQAVVNTAITADKSSNTTVPVIIQVQRPGQAQPFTATINVRKSPPKDQGPMGIEVSGKVILDSVPLWQAPFRGIQRTYEVTRDFIVQIGQIISGAIKPQFAGPVGIVKITGEVAQTVPDAGWWPILNLTAILSLNLAIINILPFPALDGGRVLLIFIELLRGGKRLKPEREGLINLVGMALLLVLIATITVSDVLHWGG